ncbi:hypothetical protein Adu01nite_55820 [Paractinoplanes durhamensis]|uniref:Uncharacterized protein n=1 Tax=Paractinoplanes durhamensis TaxID=113563 RepID=A0ABQ3Z330_9ACTN|nr:hypothetical protein Adu01nite_55820 [Actinoplanes durhamensis]
MVGPDRFAWSVGHAHGAGDGKRWVDCREIVRVRREGAKGQLLLIFRSRDGHLAADGFLMHGGLVMHADGRTLNLNEPGVVRALLDAAIAGGWQADAPGQSEVDGWPLFDA